MSGGSCNIPDTKSYPLIVYIHVPKTAGSTVTKVLYLCTPRGIQDLHLKPIGWLLDRLIDPDQRSLDYIPEQVRALLNSLRDCDWISGHVSRDRITAALVWLNRPIEFFATIRDPVQQLMSTLNFSFEKFNRPDYFGRQTNDLEAFDSRVMSTNFSKVAEVMNLLLTVGYDCLNIQSKLLLGQDYADLSEEEILFRLSTYTYISLEHSLSSLYRAFGFAQLPENVEKIRENAASRYYFDRKVFDTPELQAFLAYHHKHDFRLYSIARDISWPAEARRPFRPVFLPVEKVDDHNFDEGEYLSANPDVAEAVKSGAFESGRAHFELFGRNEERKLRRWVSVPAEMAKIPMENSQLLEIVSRARRMRS